MRLPLPLAVLARRMKDGDLCAGDIDACLNLASRRDAAVPLATATAACGLPSPADEHVDRTLDFNELLVRNPSATFAVRISGESMRDRGILPDDVAVIDRSRAPAVGTIVLALVDGEFTIKTYTVRAGGVVLEAANPAFPDITVGEATAFEVWGVVTGIVRSF